MKMTAVILLYLFSAHCSIQAQKTSDIAAAVLTGSPLTADRAKEICGQEMEQEMPQGICFWGEIPNVSLKCRETGGRSMVSRVMTVGNPELVVPGIGSLAYQKNGCFIDKKTSVELFGTENGNGQTLWYGEISYLVCGTFDSLRKMMVCQAAEGGEDVLNMISLYLSDGIHEKMSSQSAEQFLMRYGLEGESMDVIFLNALVNDLLLILPLLLGTGLAGWCLKQGARAPSWYKKAVFWLAGALIIAVMLYLTVGHFQIPADMIPTKWSDFSFWKTWWQTQRKNLLLLLGSAQGERQLDMLWNLLLSSVSGFGAVVGGFSLLLSLGREEDGGFKNDFFM